MRKEKLKSLRADFENLVPTLEEVEQQIKLLEVDSEQEKKMRHLARLLYAGKIVEKVGVLYSFNEEALTDLLIANKDMLLKPPD